MKEAAAWLAGFQQEFTRILRTPLETAGGCLQARLPEDWSRLQVVPHPQRGADAGLENYQRMYWFRLLTTMQQEFPLTARLLGYWAFNQLAVEHLLENAPTGYDLQGIGRRFVDFLCRRDEPLYVQQAAWIDEVRSAVFMAPMDAAWSAAQLENQDPGALRLKPARNWRLVQENWPLVDLCLRLPAMQGEEAHPCPEPCEQPQNWLIQRSGMGLMHRRVSAAQARLYQLLSGHGVQEALKRWEGEWASYEGRSASEQVQEWMAISVSWELWSV